MLKAVLRLGARTIAQKRAESDQRRADKPSRRWYASAKWKRKRADQLKREPFCAFCLAQDVVSPASVADHVVRHGEDWARFWTGKLQSLCARCHSSEKQRQEKSEGRGGLNV